MPLFLTDSRRFTPFFRATAALSVGLVLVLSWLAVDPAAHHWTHAHGAAHDTAHGSAPHTRGAGEADGLPVDESGCVISQFAQGQVESWVDEATACELAAAGHEPAIEADREIPARIRVSPPGRGPPRV